ncbi:uncharacterized protein [Mytilus edulis]|uniref:uncharacterized protein n=1 Tax=Mytilus edulis TaxID=6550 RepID=UPI0039F0C0C1
MTGSDTEFAQLSQSDQMENREQTFIGSIQKRFDDLKRFKNESPGCLCAVVSLSVLLIISVCVTIAISYKEKQSCIYDESCQHINNLSMHKVQDDSNCSRKTNNCSRNIGMILKLELWEDVLKILLRLQNNFVLRQTSYDEKEIIALCKKDRNHFYISCDKPFNDNCTVIHRSEDNTTITTIQEAGYRVLMYEIPTKCIDRRAVLEWIQTQM